MLGCISLILALLRTPKLRRLAFGLIAVSVAGLVFVGLQMEFIGFSGELVPQFRWKGKELARSTSSPAIPINPLEDESWRKYRFPRYLGEDGQGVVKNDSEVPEWNTDWNKTPPEILWRIPVGRGWSGFAVADGIAVTQEELNGEDCITGYEISTGKLVWKHPQGGSHFNALGSGGPRATPTIDDDRVYAQSSTGRVSCIEHATGKHLWTVDLLDKAGLTQAQSEEQISWGRSGSPLVTSKAVILPLGGLKNAGKPISLIALSKEDGSELWRNGDDQISYASPAAMNFLNVEQIVSVNENSVTGHNPADGSILWSIPWEGASNGAATNSQMVQVDRSDFIVSKGYGIGCKRVALSITENGVWSATLVWENKSLMKTKFMTPIMVGENLYGLSDGIFESLRVSDGKRLWKDSRDGRFGHGQMLLVQDWLVATTEDGRLLKVRPSDTKPTSYESLNVFSEITWNPLAIDDDIILTRNASEAVCLRLTKAPSTESK
jgi:outer membrane protein assembly factor BamB